MFNISKKVSYLTPYAIILPFLTISPLSRGSPKQAQKSYFAITEC